MSDEYKWYDYYDKVYASRYIFNYDCLMAVAELKSTVSYATFKEIKEYSKQYDVISKRCEQMGLSMHELPWPKEVKTFFDYVENFDYTLKCKLAKNYQKNCNIAKNDFNKNVKPNLNTSSEYIIRTNYTSWNWKFSALLTATEIFLKAVNENDTDEVKAQVPFAKEFKAFLDNAEKSVVNSLNAIKNEEIRREKALKEEREKRRREQAEQKAREAERIAAEKAAKEAAEQAERERLAAIEQRRIELSDIIKEIMPIEGKQLDDQQIDCIIDDSHNTLVIAGAGSGKTTTIIGKVKYLLHTKQCKPDEILLLSFTHKSAEEMKNRLKTETGIDMNVFTFHKLGMEIIAGVEKKKPTVYSKSLQFYARQGINKYLSNRYYREELLNYCFLNPSKARSVFDFESYEEMYEYNGTSPTITINKEYVKSRCELEIANFLFRNGIKYTYEKPYKYNTADKNYSGYKPDFYLEDYDIYIEFYAVDKLGNVPKWFKGKYGLSGRKMYQDSITWKRRLHQENGTRLIELYYADKQDGRLLEVLQQKLEAKGVRLFPMSDDELFCAAQNINSYPISNTAEIIGNVISLVKANGYSYDFFEKINKNPKNISIIKLGKPIARDYEQMLRETGQIDFNDMIYNACKYFKYGKATHKYKYVIVDEYQDISKARCSLLKEMRKQKDFSLFCVGDDWQSIYRFAGSDVGYILDFEEYWGETEKYKIETTYRFPIEILQKSGEFIMCNPSQIKKELKTSNIEHGELDFISEKDQQTMVDSMTAKLLSLPENSTVFLIGRYTADKEILKFEDTPYNVHFDNVDGKYVVTLTIRRDLKIEFLTAHKSKGLQADYVFIINNKHVGMGFPSRISNDSVINFLLRKSDDFPYSEERRLFYVALTRAKKSVWLLVEEKNRSIFVRELMESQRFLPDYLMKYRYW